MYLCVLLLRCRYGAHLSREEVAELVAPHPDTLKIVHSWFAYHGVQSSSIETTHGGNWLTVTGVLVSQANKLLGASYQLYRRAGTNDTAILRTVGYALPTVLHAHVQTVAPTTSFAPMHSLRQIPLRHSVGVAGAAANATSREPVTVLSRRDDPPTDRYGVVPSFLRALYKTVSYVPAATDRNKIAVAGFKNDFASREDLTIFMSVLRSDAIDAIFEVEQINGGEYDSSFPGKEANLDMQYSQAIAYPTPAVFYSTGGQMSSYAATGEPAAEDAYLNWFGHLLAKSIIPQTITTSFGINEKELEPQYLSKVCLLFGQLGLRGVSVFSASGDHGVGEGDCRDSSGKVQFNPTFPASCMCGVSSLLASSTQTQAQFAYHIASVSQVPGSLASAERRNHPRSRLTSPGAASRTIFRALSTSP